LLGYNIKYKILNHKKIKLKPLNIKTRMGDIDGKQIFEKI